MIKLNTNTTQTIKFIPRQGIISSIVLENEATNETQIVFNTPYFDLSSSELIFYDSNYDRITDTSGISLVSGNDIVVVENSVIKVYNSANYSGSLYGAYLRVPVVGLTENAVVTFNVDNTKDTHNYEYQYAYLIDSDGNYFNYQNGFGVTNDSIDFFEEDPIDEGYLSYSVNVPKELGYLDLDIDGFSTYDNSGDNFYTVENLTVIVNNELSYGNYVEEEITATESFLQEGQTYTLKALDSSSNVLFYDKVFCTDQTDYTINKDEFKSYSQSETYKTFKG